jgi:uncharacterized repeat protein (TIGR01451 family)
MAVSVTAQLPTVQVVAQDRLTLQVAADVTVVGGGTYSPTTSNFHSVVGPTILKTRVTNITQPGNTDIQAVAGEVVTLTAEYVFPQGTVAYGFLPRVNMQDGLLPFASTPEWEAMNTGNLAAIQAIDPAAGLAGALVTFPSINVTNTNDGPATVSFVTTAYRLQNRNVAGSAINHNTALYSRAGSRWCASDGCTVNPTGLVHVKWDTANGAEITAIQPDVTPSFDPVQYQDDKNVGAGDGQVIVPIKMTNAAGRPGAYDRVLTVPVPSGLIFVSASDGGSFSSGNVVWSLPSVLAAGASETVNMTLKFPATLQIGTVYPLTGGVVFGTIAGESINEGSYTKNATASSLRPGLSVVTKTSTPGSGAITMGNEVSYTVIFNQGANTTLVNGYIVDTLPLGFQYVADSLSVVGATVNSTASSEGPATGSGVNARYHQNLRWNMADSTTGAAGKTVTATFTVLNTGLDYRDKPVYDSAADLAAVKNSIITNTTGSVLNWTAPSGSSYTSAARANSGTLNVIQPMMNNAQFVTARNGTSPLEIGQSAFMIMRFRNSGAAPGTHANELQVCDTLPAGFVFEQTISCSTVGFAASCPTYTPPVLGSQGKVCWDFTNLPRTDAVTKYYELNYQITASSNTFPGMYTNNATVNRYSSQAGDVPGERNYASIPAALPAPANCGASCLPVLGLKGEKTAVQPSVAPGDIIEYILTYEDTSLSTNYTNLVIEDIYDPLLTFVSADPAPSSHIVSEHKLTWQVGSLPQDGSGQIMVVMQVAPEVSGYFSIWNKMAWDSAQSERFEVTHVTPLQVGDLSFRLNGPENTHAGQDISFSVVYSNTGTSNLEATLTLDYGSYLSYVSANPAPQPGQDNVFLLQAPNDGIERTATLNLKVNAPLPYTLEDITLGMQLSAPGTPDLAGSHTMTLQRPILQFKKISPSIAAAPGNTMSYNFTLTNVGDFPATNLVITDIFDPATSFASPGTAWTVSGDGKSANYPIATLEPGMSASITPLAVKVEDTKYRYYNLAKVQSAQTTVQEDSVWTWAHILLLDIEADQDPAFPGRTLEYTVEYQNTDPNNGIGNATANVSLPPDFSFEGQTTSGASGCASGWNFNLVNQKAIWSCSFLSGNSSGHFKIWGKVNAEEDTDLSITADSSGAHPVAAWTMDEPVLTRVARPWLRVNASTQPTHPVAPQDNLTYTFTYENYGSDPGYNVTLKNQLPTEMVSFVSCSSGCTQSNGLVTWNVGTVNKNTSGSVSVTVKVKAGTENQTIVNASFTIQSDRLSISDTLSGPAVETSVLTPSLGLMMSSSLAIVNAPNDEVTFTINATNNGGGTLTGVVVTNELSTYTIFRSASEGCTHSGEAVGGVVSCQLGEVNQGQTKTVTMTVGISTGLSAHDVIVQQALGISIQSPQTNSNTIQICYQSCPLEQPQEKKLFLPIVRR